MGHALVLWMMVIQLSIFVCVESSTNLTEYGRRFKCEHSSALSSFETNAGILSGEVFPIDFKCQSVGIPDTFSMPMKWFIKSSESFQKHMALEGNGGRDLCERVGYWERTMNVNCSKLLCEHNSVDFDGFISGATRNETKLQDWINYCQYCSSNTVAQYEMVENRLCVPRDSRVGALLRRFPQSISYCGIEELGIPFVVERSQVPDIDYLPDYVILCYCTKRNLFGARCNSMNDITIIGSFAITIWNVLSYFIVCVALFFIVFLPKLVASIKKKQLSYMFTILFAFLTTLFSLICFLIIAQQGMNNGSSTLSSIAIISLIVGLYSWIISWYRIVQFARTRVSPRTLWLNLLLTGVWIVIGVANTLVSQFLTETFNVFILVTTSVVGFLAVILFAVTAAWIHKTMKQISDINILQTTVCFHSK